MKELIEQLEKATEPSRDLDREILFNTFPKDRVAIFDGVKHISTMTGRDGEFWFNPLADRDDCPRYTGSLDDALDLAPDGCGFLTGRVCWEGGRPIDPRYWAEIAGPRASNEFRGMSQASLAIAVCIAALKARELTV